MIVIMCIMCIFKCFFLATACFHECKAFQIHFSVKGESAGIVVLLFFLGGAKYDER